MGNQIRNAVAQLDFEEDPPTNIWDATSRCLKHFGDQGATVEDLAGLFQKNITQWKVASISPALSNLEKVGCCKHVISYGIRRYFHLKSFTETEHHALTQMTSEANARRKEEKIRREVEARLEAAKPRDEQKMFGKDAAIVLAKGKMMFAVGERDTIVLEPKQARELYEQLKAVFE